MKLYTSLENLDNIPDGQTRKLINDNQILWGPDYNYMGANQIATLSQKISSQRNGIVLVWQAFENGEPKAWDFNFTYIPKYFVTVFPSGGVVCQLSNSSSNILGTKYVYVYDDKIQGHAFNSTGNTTKDSGIKTTNNHWVLTYVLGV